MDLFLVVAAALVLGLVFVGALLLLIFRTMKRLLAAREDDPVILELAYTKQKLVDEKQNRLEDLEGWNIELMSERERLMAELREAKVLRDGLAGDKAALAQQLSDMRALMGLKPTSDWRKSMYKLMQAHLNSEGIADVAFDMEISMDQLVGEGAGLSARMRALIEHCINLEREYALLRSCRKVRPQIRWPDFTVA